MIETNGIHADGIRKQEILDFLFDFGIHVYVEEQLIDYYKNGHWFGRYYLKDEYFYYDWKFFFKFFDKNIYDNELKINELLKLIIEEIIKRKVFVIQTPF